MLFLSQAFSEKCLRSAITFEVERGYSNALGRNMRYCCGTY